MTFLFEGIEVQQLRDEIEGLVKEMKRLHVNSVLEIGYYFGGTAKIWDSIINNGFVMSIDLKMQGYERRFRNKFSLYLGDSMDYETREHVINTVQQNGHFDMMFVDGNHAGDYAYDEFYFYKPYVEKIVVFHDINNENISRQYWKLIIKEQLKHLEVLSINNPQPGWNGIGIVYL